MYNDTRVKKRNRKRIVDVAVRLFTEKGIGQTSVLEICEKAEVERQTFYNYFSNKKEIADYIYYLHLHEFYSEGFNDDDYEACENGFEKLKKYYDTVLDRYFEKPELTVFLVHYDYYRGKNTDFSVMNKVYETYNMVSPGEYFLQGMKDGSIYCNEENPSEFMFVLLQTLGAYANRLIYRSYGNGNNTLNEQKQRLKMLVDLQMEFLEMKKEQAVQ